MKPLPQPRPKDMPKCVKDFLERTYPNSKTIDREMGWLKDDGITPEQFSEFCREFAQGVMYVKRKFPHASSPDKIIFCNTGDNEYLDDQTQAAYDPNDLTIIVNRRFCRNRYDGSRIFHADHERKIEIRPAESVILTGIEEAYHHNQNKDGARCRKKHMSRQWELGADKPYLEDPIEQDADRFVLAAARELGFIPKIKGRSR